MINGCKMDETTPPKTISVVEAGRKYFGLKPREAMPLRPEANSQQFGWVVASGSPLSPWSGCSKRRSPLPSQDEAA